jgi:hypothetical protein
LKSEKLGFSQLKEGRKEDEQLVKLLLNEASDPTLQALYCCGQHDKAGTFQQAVTKEDVSAENNKPPLSPGPWLFVMGFHIAVSMLTFPSSSRAETVSRLKGASKVSSRKQCPCYEMSLLPRGAALES